MLFQPSSDSGPNDMPSSLRQIALCVEQVVVDQRCQQVNSMMACSSMPRADVLNALTHDRPTACSVPDAMMLNRDCNNFATLIGRARSSVGCETSVLSPAIIIVITNVTATASTLAVARGRLLIPLRYRYTWTLDFPPPTGRESTWVCTFEAYKHGILLNRRPRRLSLILTPDSLPIDGSEAASTTRVLVVYPK